MRLQNRMNEDIVIRAGDYVDVVGPVVQKHSRGKIAIVEIKEIIE